MKYDVGFDTTLYVEESLEVQKTLYEAIGLVILVILSSCRTGVLR